MKTTVSVPDELFERADRLARSSGRSRSEVYSAALREYVARHSPDEITETLDRVLRPLDEDAATDAFVERAAKLLLEHNDW
jgi:metal-responsive CopG/Arc/MetJ family transcriptional regulator